MMRKTTKTKTIAIATAITTLLSATAVFADTTSSNTVQAPKFSQIQPCEAHGWFKSRLDSLVTSGTLNQAQEDTIQNALSKTPKDSAAKGEAKTNRNGQVKTNTMTQSQKDAIQSS